MCYLADKEFAKKAENYFLIWIENDEFKKELAVAGFDTNLDILKKSKHVFKKYLDYFGAIEEQIERIKNGTDAVSHEIMTYHWNHIALLKTTDIRKCGLTYTMIFPECKRDLMTI